MSRLLTGLSLLMAAASLCASAESLPAQNEKTSNGDRERIWIVPEYFGVLSKKSPYADFPLVTKGDLNTPRGGVLGEPGTAVVFDEAGEDTGIRHGFQLTLGGWIAPDREWGAELGGGYAPRVSARTTVSMDAATRLCIPYFDAHTGAEQAFPYDPATGILAAGIGIANRQQLWSVSALALKKVRRGETAHIDLKFGIRSLNLEDEFRFEQQATSLVPLGFAELPAFPGTFTATDTFKAWNDFGGASIGARFAFAHGRLRAEIQPQVSLGANLQTVEIRGRSTALNSDTDAFHVRSGGFWALDTNIGENRRARLSVVPEIKLKIGVEILKHLEFQAGYSFTYWSEVVRAGDQVSRVINVDKVPIYGYGPLDPLNPAVPTFRFRTTDFWAHGITAGFTIRF